MKKYLLLIIVFYCPLSFSNMNGSYVGIDFGYTHFKIRTQETRTRKAEPIIHTKPNPPQSGHTTESESDTESSASYRSRSITPTSSVSDQAGIASDATESSTSDRPRSTTPTSSSSEGEYHKLDPGVTSDNSDISFVHVSSSSESLGLSYHQSPSSGDERVPSTHLDKDEDIIVPGIIRSLSTQSPNPSVFLRLGYGEEIGMVYVGSEIKIGRNLSLKGNAVHKWNYGIALKKGFYVSPNCLVYTRLGIDRDKLVLHNTNDLYMWSLLKGIRIDYMVSPSTFISFTIEHSNAVRCTSNIKVLNRGTRSITVKTGVGFKI